MSEHLRNLRLVWVAYGWFIAVALTALPLVALSSLDLIRPDTPAESTWVAFLLLFGFAVAGFFVGTRVNAAPLLHGVAIGLFTLVVWAAANLLLGEPTGVTAWDTLDTGTALTLVLFTTAGALIGTRAGVRWARRTV